MCPAKEPIENRFWKKVNKTGSCWEWTGTKTRTGYGQIKAGTPSRIHDLAHRVSWRIHFGEIPSGLCVLHSCDNKKCVNPSHLFVGTYQDNTDDMMNKNRHRVPFGEKSASAKLKEREVRAIRAMHDIGFLYSEISKFFSVTATQVREIVLRKNWKHVV
jgi:hypothetical protein